MLIAALIVFTQLRRDIFILLQILLIDRVASPLKPYARFIIFFCSSFKFTNAFPISLMISFFSKSLSGLCILSTIIGNFASLLGFIFFAYFNGYLIVVCKLAFLATRVFIYLCLHQKNIPLLSL